jgi:ABC-type lipoprotein release transport system permease subunit
MQEMRRKEQTAIANLRALGLSDEQITQAMGL